MKNITPNSSTALVIRKETSLTIIHNITNNMIRISSKAFCITFALTLLNMVI